MALGKYEIAKLRSNEIDACIIKTLQSGQSFRVEAGAGSGKTYSLNKVIDWIQDNYWQSLNLKKQKVACITYTNAGVDVIASRLRMESFIEPMTIHTFAWGLIKQFEHELKKKVVEENLLPDGIKGDDFDMVHYEIGARYVENRVLYLHHNDVILLFARFMDNKKFRQLMTVQYPIVLIDEYQDSLKAIIDQFLNWFIDMKEGPQFGFFGDAWQTIYEKSSCGIIDSANIAVIGKEANFRSQQVIVDVLNEMRPELPQICATDENDGFVKVITCNDFCGDRQKGYYKGELPNDILIERIDNLQEKLDKDYQWNDEHITLMITHKMLAKQQSYVNLLEMLDERLKDGDDPYLEFFSEVVEPLYSALEEKRLTRIFDVLGSRGYPIEYKGQKRIWSEFEKRLEEGRKRTIGDVMKVLFELQGIQIPIPPKVQESHKKYLDDPENQYGRSTIGHLYGISYSEVLNTLEFLSPNAEYSTDHGVKGEEYQNVLFVVGRGWNNYQFDKYMGCDSSKLKGNEYDAYVRNRNLFYVCCSRPRKRLFLFITVPVEGDFMVYLKKLFGVENICTYSEFMSEDK